MIPYKIRLAFWRERLWNSLADRCLDRAEKARKSAERWCAAQADRLAKKQGPDAAKREADAYKIVRQTEGKL